ncbi:ARID DNA-binding domain-containing protein [Artemisia annua]|uniref:ARID DNA-binding domain-containing protein n=1 Tax=Artemisia annua TaxID=35608 RepID=A0A2U1KH42_ARTAN|nr:ARID DNA-binding domain-containing protein [Artemisia annua]
MTLESVREVMVVSTERCPRKCLMSLLKLCVWKKKQRLFYLARFREFEDVVRMPKDLSAIIPTLDAVKGALSVVKFWLTKFKPILVSDLNFGSESMLLNILLKEWSLLEDVLENFMQWESNAYTALDDA